MDPITRFIFIAASGASKGPFDCNFLVIGGGGSQGGSATAWHNAGGGAGGYISSWNPQRDDIFATAEYSGAMTTALNPLNLEPNTTYTVSIGAGGQYNGSSGSNTDFAGTDSNGNNFNISAIGGGVGGGASNGGTGGSGGGAGLYHASYQQAISFSSGAGTSNQGNQGGNAVFQNTHQAWMCSAYGGTYCLPSSAGTGGGGGAGGQGGQGYVGGLGGDGIASTITGTSVYRAAGGNGYSFINTVNFSTVNGSGSDGSGGTAGNAAPQNGRIYLRYPKGYTMTNPGGGLVFQSGWTGGYTSTIENCTEIVSGSGTIEFI